MKQIFLDTDVVIDFLINRQPFSVNAIKLFDLSYKKKLIIYVTPLTFSNTYYILRKLAPHKKIIEKLKDLLVLIDIQEVNKKSIEHALTSDFTDFEDAIQNFSATQNPAIEVLITRNIKDYKKSKLAVMSPETFIKSFV